MSLSFREKESWVSLMSWLGGDRRHKNEEKEPRLLKQTFLLPTAPHPPAVLPGFSVKIWGWAVGRAMLSYNNIYPIENNYLKISCTAMCLSTWQEEGLVGPHLPGWFTEAFEHRRLWPCEGQWLTDLSVYGPLRKQKLPWWHGKENTNLILKG